MRWNLKSKTFTSNAKVPGTLNITDENVNVDVQTLQATANEWWARSLHTTQAQRALGAHYELPVLVGLPISLWAVTTLVIIFMTALTGIHQVQSWLLGLWVFASVAMVIAIRFELVQSDKEKAAILPEVRRWAGEYPLSKLVRARWGDDVHAYPRSVQSVLLQRQDADPGDETRIDGLKAPDYWRFVHGVFEILELIEQDECNRERLDALQSALDPAPRR